MTHLLQLEDFGAAIRHHGIGHDFGAEPAAPPAPTPAEIEAMKLTTYEQGYKAGWDDAEQSVSDQSTHIGAEFARNIQDLGFTFYEAKTHVMKSLEPLLIEIVSKVLPRLISETLGQTILEELLPFAEELSDAPLQIVVAPSGRSVIEGLVDASLTIPMDIIEEPSLAEGQVYLRMGAIEKKIDMDSAIERIAKAIASIYVLNEEAIQNG